jgi:hypothetical protein
MQSPIIPVGRYGQSGSILLLNPTDRDLRTNYAIPNTPASGPMPGAIAARMPEVIRSPIVPTFIGGTSPATITFTSMAPATAVHGGADVTVIFNGTGFTPETSIIWNGSPEVTTYISPTQVSTLVKPSLVSGAVTVNNAVQKPGEVPTATRPFVFT